jgi:hypothetical protein
LFHFLALNERKIQEFPYHLLKLDDAGEHASFLASDITIMTALYTPLTKYDLFAYLKCSHRMFLLLLLLLLLLLFFTGSIFECEYFYASIGKLQEKGSFSTISYFYIFHF